MAFTKFGKKFTAGRQAGKREYAEHHDGADDYAGPTSDEAKHSAIPGFEPALKERIFCFANAFAKENVGESWREREGNDERRHDCEDVAQSERSKETTLKACQCKNRKKNERDDERGKDYRAANFKGGVKDNGEYFAGADRLARLAFTKPAKNIFHVNDGVVHNFPESDCKSAKSNGVNGDAKFLQHDDCGQKRQRYGGQGD